MSVDYNLLEERWIPVLWANGEYGHVGIVEALREAGRIRQIAASNPMDRVAVLRFLLALLYWCRGNPPAAGGLSANGGFPEVWLTRLHDERQYFNLLGDGRRFYQDATARRRRPTVDLLQEVPGGNNYRHFRHSADYVSGLCLSCCAMGLLRLPLYSLSGLPNVRAGINGTPPVYVVPLGDSLLSTLQLNWTSRTPLGVATWEDPLVRPTPGECVPLLTGMTLLSRRVWLHESEIVDAPCIGCGRRDVLVLVACEFQTGGEQENTLWDDPHVLYLDTTPRRSIKAPDPTESGSFRSGRHWVAPTAATLEMSWPLEHGALMAGLATSKGLYVDVWEFSPHMVVDSGMYPAYADSVRLWPQHGAALARQCRNAFPSLSDPKREKLKRYRTLTSALAAIRPHVEDRVSARIGELLAGGEIAWELAASEYCPLMAAVARSLSPGVTTAAVERRVAMASSTPTVGTPMEQAGKPKRRKGGAQ